MKHSHSRRRRNGTYAAKTDWGTIIFATLAIAAAIWAMNAMNQAAGFRVLDGTSIKIIESK